MVQTWICCLLEPLKLKIIRINKKEREKMKRSIKMSRMFGVCIAILMLSISVCQAAEDVKLKPQVKAHWKKMNQFIQDNIAKCQPYLFRTYNAYWADTPPVIDGKMDDSCWKQAEVAGDFFKHGFCKIRDDKKGVPPRPHNQTEVRVAYDAENIYIFYKLLESDMSKLVKGQPQDYQDVLNVHADTIELFLQPVNGKDRAVDEIATNMDYYQICANPMGSTYTARAYSDKSWNSDLKIKTSLSDKFWTVEMSIPISDLYRGDGEASTPKIGETWGALFCRDQSTYHDWSRWTTSGISSSGGFHNRESFGNLVFKGRRDGKNPPEAKVALDKPLNFGENAINLTLPSAIEGKATVFCDGKKTWEKDLSRGMKGDVNAPVSAGGKVLVHIALTDNGKEVQAFYARKDLPRVVNDLREIIKQTEVINKNFAPYAKGWKNGAVVLTQAENLEKQAKESLQVFSGNKVSEKDVKGYMALAKDWKAFTFDAACANAIIKTKAKAGAVFVAQPLLATCKVFHKVFDQQDCLKKVELLVAGNEYESFQIVLTPLWKNLEKVNVLVSPLKGKAGTIPAANITWFKEDYTEMDMDYRKTLPGYNPDDPDSLRWWPDILWPGRPEGLAVPEGRYTTLWVDVFCPPDTKAGEYKGMIIVKAGKTSVNIPITLVANGLNLPTTPTLRNNHWYSTMWIGRFARSNKLEMEKVDSMELLKRQVPTLSRYRVSTYPWNMWNLVDSYLEPDGSFTFDFSRVDKAVDYCRANGANWLCSSFGCNPGGIIPIYSGTQPITIRSTGEKVNLNQCAPMKKYYSARVKTKEERQKEEARTKKLLENTNCGWRGTPYLKAFYPAFAKYLKSKGLLEASYFEANDEAGPEAIVPFWHAFKKIAPSLPIMNYGPYPNGQKRGLSCEGYQDMWAPGLSKLDNPETVKCMKERRNKYGEDYGFYVCGSMPPDAEGRYTPFMKPNESALGTRILPWFAWKYDCDHFLVFMMFTGLPPTAWPNEPARTGSVGYAPMFYPLQDWTLIPAVRTAHLRDGMEDYEYFQLLKQRAGRLDPKFPPHRKLLDKINQELEVEQAIARNSLDWTKDVRLLNAKRQRIVNLINEADKATATYMEDALKK
jgi:hypothetical protein